MAEMQQEEVEQRTRYELGFHLLPTLGEEDVTAAVAALKEMVHKQGGTIVGEKYPQRTALSYPMEHRTREGVQRHGSAHFGWVLFDMEGKALPALHDEVKNIGSLLRFIVVKTEPDHVPPHTAGSVSGETALDGAATPAKTSPSFTDDELDKRIEELVKE